MLIWILTCLTSYYTSSLLSKDPLRYLNFFVLLLKPQIKEFKNCFKGKHIWLLVGPKTQGPDPSQRWDPDPKPGTLKLESGIEDPEHLPYVELKTQGLYQNPIKEFTIWIFSRGTIHPRSRSSKKIYLMPTPKTWSLRLKIWAKMCLSRSSELETEGHKNWNLLSVIKIRLKITLILKQKSS